MPKIKYNVIVSVWDCSRSEAIPDNSLSSCHETLVEAKEYALAQYGAKNWWEDHSRSLIAGEAKNYWLVKIQLVAYIETGIE